MIRGVLLVVLVLAAIVLFNAAYTVDETEQVVVIQFGKPVGDPVTEPGLHFKTPFLQQVRRLDKRILEWEGEQNTIPTKEKRYLLVDTTARWRIVDPLLFLQSVRGEEATAQSRLDDILDNAARTWISSHDLIEAVRSTDRAFADAMPDEGLEMEAEQAPRGDRVTVGRAKLVAGILEQTRPQIAELGIELVDFRFRRIEYDVSTRASVYERMRSERFEVAARYESEGRARQAEIEGEMGKELKRLESDAVRRAEIIRGEADAEAARIYAEAFGADPDFFAFWQTLDTWRRSLARGDTTLVLTTGSDLLRFWNGPGVAKPGANADAPEEGR